MYTELTTEMYSKYSPNILKAAERDNYLCVDCGKKSQVVHHIDESRKNGIKKMNNSLDNLVSLCRRCHMLRHGIGGNITNIKKLRDKGLSFQAIADIFSVSRQRAHQIYKKEIAMGC